MIYDYFYLNEIHNKYAEEKTDTVIVTGLSYGLDGFDSWLCPHSYNFSMHSQDIYYDMLHIKKILSNENANPKACILCYGYYSLFYDLSLSKNAWRSILLYDPLFSDKHHADPDKVDYSGCVMSTGMPTDGGEREASLYFRRVGYRYYGPNILQPFNKNIISKAESYLELSQEEREEDGRVAAELHSKHIKHVNTFMENSKIFIDMMSMLHERGTRVCVCIMPFAKSYVKNINPAYKIGMLDFFDKCGYPIEFIDLNDIDIWKLTDFMDTMHLNQEGSAKATAFLMDKLGL